MGNTCCVARTDKCNDAAPDPLLTEGRHVQLVDDALGKEHCQKAKTPWFLGFCCRRRSTTLPPPRDLRHFSTAAAQHSAIVADVRSAFPSGSGDWIVSADAQRMLVATEGDDQLARKKLKQAVRWRETTLEGWIASEGGDRKLPMETRAIALGAGERPLLYVCGVHQVTGEVPPVHFAVVWQQLLASAPPCTQMDFVMDCFGFQLLLNLHIGPWLKLAPSLDSYFAERLHSIIVLDMPAAARFIWKAVRPLLPPKTREKIRFCSYKSPSDMKLLYDICLDDDARCMLKSLIEMNREATNKTGRHQSHALTRGFLERQIDMTETAPADAAWIQTWLNSAKL